MGLDGLSKKTKLLREYSSFAPVNITQKRTKNRFKRFIKDGNLSEDMNRILMIGTIA